MMRLILITLVVTTFFCCQKVNLNQTCIGEWGYTVGDTAYCELLIDGSNVYPYHHRAVGNYGYRYEIKGDSFYIYGNKTEIVERSPIEYLGPNSFQILAITPSVLRRISYEEAAGNSLSKYRYRVKKLTQNKTALELYEDHVFSEIEMAHQIFESDYTERRDVALYKTRKKVNQQ